MRKGSCQIQALLIAAGKGQGEKCSEGRNLTKTLRNHHSPPPQQQAAEVKGAGAQKKGRTAAPLSNLSWFDLCFFSLLVSGRTKQGGPLIPEICTSSLSSPWSPSRVRHRAHCAHPAAQGKPCPHSGMRDRCHPPPLLAGKNFSNPLATSISSFGHPALLLFPHNKRRKGKHLRVCGPLRGPSLTHTGGSHHGDLSP